MRKQKKGRDPEAADLPRKMMIWLVIACAAVVAVNLLGWIFFRDEVVAKRKMENMAREYYENYAYDKWGAGMLERYSERGLPAVSLRALLSYDDWRNEGETVYFTRTDCDTTATTVTFYPYEPYGRGDYRMEINYSCNFE